MNLLTADRSFGAECETSLLSSIKQKFGTDIIATTDKYCLYDYFNDTTLIELKSRRVSKNRFFQTMIGKNKIDFFLANQKRCICVFNYTDGAYYLEITPEVAKQFVVRDYARRDRGPCEPKKYCYIPINLLQPLCTPS